MITTYLPFLNPWTPRYLLSPSYPSRFLCRLSAPVSNGRVKAYIIILDFGIVSVRGIIPCIHIVGRKADIADREAYKSGTGPGEGKPGTYLGSSYLDSSNEVCLLSPFWWLVEGLDAEEGWGWEGVDMPRTSFLSSAKKGSSWTMVVVVASVSE